jgi:hypothetical protein
MSTSVDEFPTGFRVWWNPKQPDEIHLVTNDPMFHDGDGEHLGLWVTFSSKPNSANYHPVNYNRCVRALTAKNEAGGKPCPVVVPEHDRRLKSRNRLIALWNGGLRGTAA